MRQLLIIIFLLLSALPASAQQGETRRFFKDWLAACRSDGYCSALSYVNPHADGADADYVLRVGRQPQETYWELSFATVATQGDPSRDFVVSVDGVAQTFSGPEQFGAYAASNDFYFLGDGAQAVMDRLAPGKRLSVSFTDDTGEARSATFSLNGLSAALMWIDDRQHRIGSERVAFNAPYGLEPVGGNRAGSELAGVPAALIDRLRADPECQPLEDIANGDNFEIGRLDDGHTIYVLPCWGAAYNFGSKVYVGTVDGEFEEQYFARYLPAIGMTATSYIVNASFDEDTRTLSSFNKARGVGDCGDSGDWVWNQYSFVLKTFRYKDCPESPTEADEEMESEDFPVVYTAPTP